MPTKKFKQKKVLLTWARLNRDKNFFVEIETAYTATLTFQKDVRLMKEKFEIRSQNFSIC